MRYMHWSYDQFMACPLPYIEVILDLANEEREEFERNRKKN